MGEGYFIFLLVFFLFIQTSHCFLNGLKSTLPFYFEYGNYILPYNNSKHLLLVVIETGIFLVDRTTNTSVEWYRDSTSPTQFRVILNIQNIYYSLDTTQSIIRRHRPDGSLIDVWCGNGSGGGTDCKTACFSEPYAMMFHRGYIHLTDYGNDRLVHINITTKEITTTNVPFGPQSLCHSISNPSTFWFSTYSGRYYQFNLPTNSYTLIAGEGTTFNCIDNQIGTTASLGRQPYGCRELGPFVYFADKGCSKLRRFNRHPPHSVETVAGIGRRGCSPHSPLNKTYLDGPQNLLLLDGIFYTTEYYCSTISLFQFDEPIDTVKCTGNINVINSISCYDGNWVIPSFEGAATLNITGGDTVIPDDITIEWLNVTNAQVTSYGSVSGSSSFVYILGSLHISEHLSLNNSEIVIHTSISEIVVNGSVNITNSLFRLITDLNPPSSPILLIGTNSTVFLDNVTVDVVNCDCSATLYDEGYGIMVALSYTSSNSTTIPIGLVVGVVVSSLLLIILVSIYCIYSRRTFLQAENKRVHQHGQAP